jgi:hypothetical protein
MFEASFAYERPSAPSFGTCSPLELGFRPITFLARAATSSRDPSKQAGVAFGCHRASYDAALMLEVVVADKRLSGEEAATTGISERPLSREGADDGESCEVSSLRRGDRGSDVCVLWRRSPGRCG